MKRALCIGLNYPGTAYQLGGCVHDAELLAKAMQDAGANVNLLRNVCSAEDFLRAVETYKSIQKKSDTLYLSYSGHGTQWEENSQTHEGICLYNGTLIEVLSDADFNAALSHIPGTVIVLLDSCFSGGMERAVAFPGHVRKYIAFDPKTMTIVKPRLSKATVPQQKRINMFACAKAEVSWDLGSNGLFTAKLMEAYAAGARTVGKLMLKAYKGCVPDQHPVVTYAGTTGNKRIF